MGPSPLAPCCAERRHPKALPRLDALDDDPDSLAREQHRRDRGLLTAVTDAHTHFFPRGFYEALWRWFDQHAWSIAFRGGADEVLDELVAHGVSTSVALVYAHKPGVAAVLNRFVADLQRAHPSRVIALGTVLPGEPGALDVVDEAVRTHHLRGIKLHCHVQRIAIDDPRVLEVLRACASLRVPAVVHCGREPASTAYGIDPRALCNVARTERVLQAIEGLTLVVPHIGADEFDGYLSLAAQYEGLYLDTSMACAEYFEDRPRWADIERMAHKIMYGSDFPIVPYECDRELRLAARRIEHDGAFEQLVRGTARRIFGHG